MRKVKRALSGLVVGALALLGLVAGTGPAYAADVTAVVVPAMDFRSQYEDQGRAIPELEAQVWCNSTYDVMARPAEEQIAWLARENADVAGLPFDASWPDRLPFAPAYPGWPLAGSYDPAMVAAVISISVPRDSAATLQAVDLSPAMCGFTRYWHDATTYATAFNGWESALTSSGKGLRVQIADIASGHSGGGGTIYGEKADGTLVPVALHTLAVNRSFDPETGDKDPAAAPDTGHVPVGAASVRVAILDNDDLPNGIKALELVTLPTRGEATIDFTADGWPIDYRPEAGFVGQDTFSYRVTDDLDKTSETTVVITIDGPEIEDPSAPPSAPPVTPPTVPPTTTPPAADPTPTATPTAVPFLAATGLEASNGSSLVWWISITGGTVLLGLVLAAVARRRGAL